MALKAYDSPRLSSRKGSGAGRVPTTTRPALKKSIAHAIGQWDLATDQLVTTERQDEDCVSNHKFAGGADRTRDQGAHPQIVDSVMSYQSNPSFNCSPHLFDTMAIYALYHSR